MATIDEQKLLGLSPTAFENLTYDLLRAGDLTNVSWRTPGADGGRDIEGFYTERDPSGYTKKSRWLIECKRYSNTVNWPTVWEKVAYGDSGDADVLLLVTSSKFSTRCIDEIDKWNGLNRRPAIRVWPRHEVVFRLSLKIEIAQKYSLTVNKVAPAQSIADLAIHVARMTQAVMASISANAVSDRHVYAATSLANLLHIRSIDLAEASHVRVSPGSATSALPPAYITSGGDVDVSAYDSVGLNCLLASFHVIMRKAPKLSMHEKCIIVKVSDDAGRMAIETKLVKAVSFWSSVSVDIVKGEGICLIPQTLN